MFSINKKSHVLCHVIKLWLFGTPQSCTFGKIVKKFPIDLISRHELNWKFVTWGSHIQKSHAENMCKVDCKWEEKLILLEWLRAKKRIW